MRRPLLLLPLCTAFALLAGCGNKGPLYLPKATPPAPVQPAKPAAKPATPAATPATPAAPTAAAPTPVHGHVTDLTAFKAFIDTHPTPDQFRTAYPDVLLVLPGAIATRELRSDNSRYFADLDANGRITGGKFM